MLDKTIDPNDVSSVSSYVIEFTKLKDGRTILHRRSDGFTAYELLGILSITRDEIVDQMKGKIRPDIIKREVVQ